MNSIDILDKKILYLIGQKPQYPSEMARNLGIVRTTIQYRLKKLEQLNIVKSTKNGRQTIWFPIFKNDHNKNHFRIYKKDEIIQAYNQLLNLPKHTNILAVQGNEAAKNEFTSLPALFIKQAHKTFKRKQIILKGITNEKVLNIFDDLDESLVKSHQGRTTGIKLFSENIFLSAGEIISTKNILLLANPKTKQVIVIKDRGITMIVYDTLHLMFDLLDNKKTFDLNYYLKTKTSSNRKL